MVVSACAGIASELSRLEPIAGVAVAVNLAYLALNRFRYIEKIRKHASERLESLSDPNKPRPANGAHETDWYKQVQRFAGDESAKKEKLPEGFWCVFYQYFLEIHIDTVVAIGCTAIALLVLIAGVAHSVGLWAWTACFATEGWLTLWFYVTVAAIFLPVVQIIMGRRCVNQVKRWTTDCVRNLAKVMQLTAQGVDLNRPAYGPPQPPPPPRYPPPAPMPDPDAARAAARDLAEKQKRLAEWLRRSSPPQGPPKKD